MTTDKENKPKSNKGPKGGARKIYFVCCARRGEKDVVEEMEADSLESAAKAFKASARLNAANILGPYFKVVGNKAKERIFVTVDPENQDYTNQRHKGILNGWHVFAQGLKAHDEFKDNELVQIIFTKELVDPENKQPKPKINPVFIKLTDLSEAKVIKK